MGVVNHNVVIATTWDREVIERINDWIKHLPKETQKIFTVSDMNPYGYQTIILTPDGSKEGWGGSNNGDNLRELFIKRLILDNYEDDSSPWDWVEVGFGEYGQKVLQGNNENMCSNDDYYTGG